MVNSLEGTGGLAMHLLFRINWLESDISISEISISASRDWGQSCPITFV